AATPADEAITPADTLLRELAHALPHERRELLRAYVRGHVARVLRLRHTDALDADARLLDAGLDSLMAVEVRGQLGHGLPLEQPLPATLVFDHPTIGAIADYLDARLPGGTPPAATPPEPAPDACVSGSTAPADITNLSDDDVMRLLLDKLEDVSSAL